MQTYDHGEQLIEASGPDELVRLVIDFRISHQISPFGDPIADVAAFIKEISPQNDKFPKGPRNRPVIQTRTQYSILDRINIWLKRMTEVKCVYVQKPEAERRAAICEACRQNVSWKGACAPCNEETEIRSVIIKGSKPDLNFRLNACRIDGTILKASVWLEKDQILSNSDPAHPRPQECWLT